MNTDIRHIIFDLGNVMVDIHPERTIDLLAAACQRRAADISDLFMSPIHLDFMSGRLSPTGFYQAFANSFAVDIEYKTFVNAWDALIGAPKNGIVGLLSELKGSYTLSVCSNTDPLHWRRVRERDAFLGTFDRYFLSYQLDLLKPGEAIFKRLLQDLSCLPEECLFIDDTLENVRTAGALGYHTIHTDDPKEVVKHIS